MDLFEHQAKELFAAYGIPVPRGIVAHTVAEARTAAEQLTGRVVVKAQVKTGGRGKAGGVKVRRRRERRRGEGQGHPRHGHQGPHGPQGPGRGGAATSRRSTTSPSCSTARTVPSSRSARRRRHGHRRGRAHRPREAWRRSRSTRSTASTGRRPARSRRPAWLAEKSLDGAAELIERLWAVFVDEDASLVEVNPLILAADGQVKALDGKVTLDANADFRQKEHESLRRQGGARTRWRRRPRRKHLNYVKLDGNVGIIGNGAGLVMSTLDVVAYAGEQFPASPKPANFLDIGGGASAEVMANGLEIILSDPAVKSVFVNVFGGITARDAVANGIVSAFKLLGDRGEAVTPPARGPSRRQQRGTGPRDPAERRPPGRRTGRHHGRRGQARRRTRRW